jgi:DNA modification methylase
MFHSNVPGKENSKPNPSRYIYHGKKPNTGVGWGRSSENDPRDNRTGRGRVKNNPSMNSALTIMPELRNKRDVWFIATQPYKKAHFATFPPALIRPCVLAGCPMGGVILDPFAGTGTTGEVAEEEGRNSILIELNPKYIELLKERTSQQGLFTRARNLATETDSSARFRTASLRSNSRQKEYSLGLYKPKYRPHSRLNSFSSKSD